MTACSRLEAKLEARTAQVEALLPLKERMREVEAGACSTSVPRAGTLRQTDRGVHTCPHLGRETQANAGNAPN